MDDKFYEDFQQAAAYCIPRYYTTQCCIESTKMAQLVLGLYGVRLVEVPCEARYFNPIAAAVVSVNGEHGIELTERPPEVWPEGSLIYEIGTGEAVKKLGYSADTWNGHLVGIADGRVLIDLSFAQPAILHPGHGMDTLEPLVGVGIHSEDDLAEFVAGTRTIGVHADGTLVTLRPRLDNRGYLAAEAWDDWQFVNDPCLWHVRRWLIMQGWREGEKENGAG